MNFNHNRALITSGPQVPFPSHPDNIQLLGGFSLRQPISLPGDMTLPPHSRYCGELDLDSADEGLASDLLIHPSTLSDD